MGVPAFFRWLSRKYPSIVVHCIEEKAKVVNGVKIPVDSSKPNPNNVEFDNLYLDMNGIIHPCTHPEDRPAPENEEEMMIAIFEYLERIFTICRPRKLLYMAIDGVAPRAKMNQQRSRRFRASKETKEKVDDLSRIREEVLSRGGELPPVKENKHHFDSNCITPGTDFMARLAECLRYYVHDKINNDPAWRGLMVILSDSNVPGEGEHKIMDYIRRQRAQPDHDPNTHHCLCGADADLIMLGLATHEPYFTIIREEFKPNQPRACDLCRQIGHEAKECQGLPREKKGEFDQFATSFASETEFIFLRLNVLREYLERELKFDSLPFPYDFERCIDDWVFMCFYVGNDFLPHLPSLEIRENAIDRLVGLYKRLIYKAGGYLTENGEVNMARTQMILCGIGEVEDEIFKRRTEDERRRKRWDDDKKKRQRQDRRGREMFERPRWMQEGAYAPQRLGGPVQPMHGARQIAADCRAAQGPNNEAAAAALRSLLSEDGPPKDPKDPPKEGDAAVKPQVIEEPRGVKRKAPDGESDEEPEDEVRLGEDGWRDRYYRVKFDVDENDEEFRHQVAGHYAKGLCWVLRYYYQGCPSWRWFFPYHYAPFASDFTNIGDLPNDFETRTVPFRPLEQLMSVFPAASREFLPRTWQALMTNPESPVIDFYPTDFKVDLNGKKFAWQGVALLPFVDEARLHTSLRSVYPDLSEDEMRRNSLGFDRLFVGQKHPAYSFFKEMYADKMAPGKEESVDLPTRLTSGVAGKVWQDPDATMEDATIRSTLPQLPDLTDNRCLMVQFQDPVYPEGFIFPATLLKGVRMPARVLRPENFSNDRSYRPQLGFTPQSMYRGKDTHTAQRFIRGNLPRSYNNSFSQQQYSSHNRSQSWPHNPGPRGFMPRARPAQPYGQYGQWAPAPSGGSQPPVNSYRSYRPQQHHRY